MYTQLSTLRERRVWWWCCTYSWERGGLLLRMMFVLTCISIFKYDPGFSSRILSLSFSCDQHSCTCILCLTFPLYIIITDLSIGDPSADCEPAREFFSPFPFPFSVQKTARSSSRSSSVKFHKVRIFLFLGATLRFTALYFPWILSAPTERRVNLMSF